MPDAIPHPAPEPDSFANPPVPDVAEHIALVAHYCPAWIGRDGYPLTWLHAQLALAVMAREHAREQLRMAGAMGSVQAEKPDRERWRREVLQQAGW